jgi:hypothetical protein
VAVPFSMGWCSSNHHRSEHVSLKLPCAISVPQFLSFPETKKKPLLSASAADSVRAYPNTLSILHHPEKTWVKSLRDVGFPMSRMIYQLGKLYRAERPVPHGLAVVRVLDSGWRREVDVGDRGGGRVVVVHRDRGRYVGRLINVDGNDGVR